MAKSLIQDPAASSSIKENPAADLLDSYSPLKVGKIFPYNAKRKPLHFEDFRPPKDTCLDYNISETYVRWDVGDTKVRAKEIHADYVLAPPGYTTYKAPIFGSGGGPRFKWIDEVWKEKMDLKQAIYKQSFFEYLESRRLKVIKHTAKSPKDKLLTQFAVPPWFQELSFKQMETVDKLQSCIDKDLRMKTIEHTKENLAQLGLYLRANSIGIRIALKYCCAKDVEFLLILYQISHPNRTTYSVNDRLLLSSVFHLSITQMLREMHIRIPSPPRTEPKKKPPEEPPKKQKKINYESPYLEPMIPKRVNPEHTGIYKKHLIQYPESPYFSYVPDLNMQIHQAPDPRDIDTSEIDDAVELEIIEDMQKAQITYNRLPHKTTRMIVKPTVLDRCKGYKKKSKSEPEPEVVVVLPPLAELTSDHEEPCTCDGPDPDELDPICCPQTCLCDCPEGECDCKRLARSHMAALCKRCDMIKRYKQRIVVTGSKLMPDGTLIPIIQGFYKEKECECLRRYRFRWQILDRGEKMERAKIKYSIAGVIYNAVGAFYVIQSIMSPAGYKPPKRRAAAAPKPCGRAICTCADIEDYEPKVQTIESPETKPPPVMSWETAHCHCKDELKKFLALQCRCADCLEQERLENPDIVFGGTKQFICKEYKCGDCGAAEPYAVQVPVIQAVQDLHCDCLARYKEHITKLEEYKQRVKAKILLKAQEHKYSIGGVVQTKDGPVYNITGLRTPLKCICAEVDAEMRKEEELRKRMPKMPPTGRNRYAIGGVCTKEVPGLPEGENIFILTHALPNKPCTCHKLYEAFEEEHKSCMDQFEHYLKLTLDEVLEVKAEDIKRREREKQKELELNPPSPEDEEPCECGGLGNLDLGEDSDEEKPVRKLLSSSSSSGSEPDIFTGDNKCDCTIDPDAEEEDEFLPCEPCNIGLLGVEPRQAQTEIEEAAELPPAKHEDSGEEYELKRFIILDKIPCDRKKQMEIIKRVLVTLDEDGYPIARLPDCHQLPIFKLWMQLRCKKYWTLPQRKPFKKLSEKYFHPIWNCKPCTEAKPVPISKKKAEKLTWKHAEYVKNMIEDITETYYRDIKTHNINLMREAYKGIFNYEFPEFRQCFFSYMPSKEEDLILKTYYGKG